MKQYLIDNLLGKTIVIKSWEDMEKEYKLNKEKDAILVTSGTVFNIHMKHLCNREIKITNDIYDLTKNDEDALIDLYNEILYRDEYDNIYYICKEMIKEVK